MSSGVSGGFLLRRLLGSAISNATGYALGTAIAPTLVPFVQELENETWQRFPTKPLQATDVAAARAASYGGAHADYAEALMTGFTDGRTDLLTWLAGTAPPLETLLALRRRDAIDDGQLASGIAQLGYRPQWRGLLTRMLNVLPSVTDMVRFGVREVYDPAQRAFLDLDADFPPAFATDAALLGLSRERAGQYWAAHWELPSAEQMAAMLFRGELSESEFSNGLRALDYAPTWRPKLDTILRPIPPLSDMIRFAVREVYDPAQRQSLGLDADYPAAFTGQAAKHGMAAQDAKDYWAAHWRLPSAQQGYRMLWRGEITDAQLAGLLKALDYSAVWRTRLQNIAYLVPGRIDLKRMLKYDILTRAEVKAGYQRLGYQPTDAESLTQIAEKEMATSTVAQPWANRARSRLFTVVHNEFMDHSIDAAQAQSLLTQIGATATERTTIMALWNAERGIQRLELTPAQIKKAHYRGLYDDATALAELQERGMTAADAQTYLSE